MSQQHLIQRKPNRPRKRESKVVTCLNTHLHWEPCWPLDKEARPPLHLKMRWIGSRRARTIRSKNPHIIRAKRHSLTSSPRLLDQTETEDCLKQIGIGLKQAILSKQEKDLRQRWRDFQKSQVQIPVQTNLTTTSPKTFFPIKEKG